MNDDIIAIGPDGVQHVFPAGTPQAVIDGVMRRAYGPEQRQGREQAAAALNPSQEPQRQRSMWERFDDRFQNSLQESAMFGGLARWMVGRGIEGEYEVRDPETGEVIQRRRDEPATAREAVRTIETERRQELRQRTQGDEWYRREGSTQGRGAAAVATLSGELAGAALDPTSWIAWGRTAVTRAVVSAGTNTGSDGLAQIADLAAGVQDRWDYGRSALAAALGGTLSFAADSIAPTARWFTDTFLKQPEANARLDLEVGDRLNAPALTTAEIAPTPGVADDGVRVVRHPETGQEIILRGSGSPIDQVPGGVQPGDWVENGRIWRTLPEAPQKPVDAPEAPPGTHTQDAPRSASSESPDPSAPPSQALALPEAEPRADAGGPTGWDAVDWGARKSPERAAAAARHLDSLKRWIKADEVASFVRALDEDLPTATDASRLNERWIDWDRMGDPREILGFTSAIADIFRTTFDHAGDSRRGWEATAEVAQQLGVSLSDVIKTHADITGEGGIAARAGALREAALASDKAFYDQLVAIRTAIAKGDRGGVPQLVESLNRTVVLGAMDAGASAEIARALQYRQRKPDFAHTDLQGAMDEISRVLNGGEALDDKALSKVLNDLTEAYEAGGSTKLRQRLAAMRELGFWDYAGYYATANLLAAPTTHIRNALGAPIHALFQISERYVAAGVGLARTSAGLGSRERVTFQEAGAYMAGTVQSWNEALSLGLQAFKRGAPIVDARSSVMGDQATIQVPFAYSPERAAQWRARPFSLSTAGDALGVALFETVRTLGFRPSVAMDELYKGLGRRMQLNALAYREAAYRAALVDPVEADGVFADTLRALQEEPTAAAHRAAREFFEDSGGGAGRVYDPGSKEEQMALLLRSIDHRQMATDHARLLTFQDSGPIVEKMDAALKAVPLVKHLWVNFVRTPVALLKAGLVARNPTVGGVLAAVELTTRSGREKHKALIDALLSEEQALARGGAEADLVLARQIVGASVLSLFWMMWAGGNVVGKQTREERRSGVQDYSVRLPNGTWVQFTGMSPIGEMLGLVADTGRALRDHDVEDEGATAIIGAVAAAVRNNVVNKSFLKGLADFMELVSGGGYGATTDEASGETLSRQVAEAVAPRIVPGGALLRRIAQDMDPIVRDTRSFMDMILAGVPTMSDSVASRRDFLGRPLVRPQGQRGAFQAFNTSSPSQDLLERELSELALQLSDGFRIGMPPRSMNGEPLTPDEYSRLLEVQGQLYRDRRTGRNLEEELRHLIAGPEYQAEEYPESRAYQVKRVIERYREAANRAVRNPRSPLFMRDAATRTGSVRLQQETRRRGWRPDQARRRMMDYGLDPDDPEVQQLHEALFPE